MRSFLLVTISFLLLSDAAFAQTNVSAQPLPHESFWDADSLSHRALYLSVGVDLGTTWYGVLKDEREEANPILKQVRISDIRKKTAVQSGIAIGGTVLSDWCSHVIARQGHPKLAAVLRFSISGAHAWAVWKNLK